MKLLNAKDLAAELDRSEWWVCQAKKAGMPFFCGFITLTDAIQWMRDHPDFTAIDYAAMPAGRAPGHPPATADRSGAPSPRRARQTASPATGERPPAPTE